MIQRIIRTHLQKRILVGITLIYGCCLISDTNANCKTPPTYLNAYFEWNSGTSVGFSIVYSCNDGYQMSGPADHIVLVCSSEEEWTGPDIDCTEKISCSFPPSPAFGSFNVTGSGLRFQSSVTFQCQTGYTLDGPENITCTASGEWRTGDEEYIEPICNRLCTQDIYRYQYHECYELIDSRCDWNSAKLNCENKGGQLATIKDTARQSFIENIFNGYEGFLYWIGGYELDRDWKYPSDGQYATYYNWAPDEPSTSDETCVYLSNVNGVENSLKWNDEYCDKSTIDTEPTTNNYCICETDGNCRALSTTHSTYQYENSCLLFIDDVPRNQPGSITKCEGFGGKLVEIKSQNMQGFIENVINDDGFVTANWWIGLEESFDRTWSWVDGVRIETFFWAEGEPNNNNEKCLDILTHRDYRWNDDDCGSTDRKYICQYGEPKCGNPGIPLHGNMTSVKESYSVGDVIHFSCNEGYVLSDPLMERLTCQNDSTWSGLVPSCQKINCSDPVPDVPNTTSTPVSTVYRGISVYECLYGNYVLNGYPVSVCQEDGTWSTPNMTCTEILTTQKYSTAPSLTTDSKMTTFIDRPEQSTKLVPSTEDRMRGQTTEFILTERIESSLSPSIHQTEVLERTGTIQPITTVDFSTSHDVLATDGETTAMATSLTLTTETYETETTNLEKSTASTHESLLLSTDGDILTTNLFSRVTDFETSQPSNSGSTSNSIIFTQSFTTLLMLSDEAESTDVTEVQPYTSAGQADKLTSLVTDGKLTSDSLITTLSPLISDNTSTSPEFESVTTLIQSTETLHTSVGTNTDDLGRTTEISSTSDPQTTELLTTFSSESSVQTNSLPTSDTTMTSSQDNLHTMTFSSSGSSTAPLTGPGGSSSPITNDFQRTTISTFKTTLNSFPTTHHWSPESTEETYWTNGESFTNDISSFPPTQLTDSSVSKTTDSSNLISKLLSTDRLTSFSTEEPSTDQTVRKITSLTTPLGTTALNLDESTELIRTQKMTPRITKVTSDIHTRSPLHSTSFAPTTPRPAERISSSPSNSHSPTSEPGKSEKLSESYSKEPETTKQPSNKGLIIGVSVTSAVIGVGIWILLLLSVVFDKYPGLIKKRNKVHPANSESATENGQDETTKEEPLQEYTNIPMDDISNEAKPYLYNSNESIDYI